MEVILEVKEAIKVFFAKLIDFFDFSEIKNLEKLFKFQM